MIPLLKYPRTRHLEGSRLQPGDEDLDCVPFSELAGKFLVVEEKLDGANAGLSFDEDGTLRLQSRGHYLTGGAREKHFNLFKQWAGCHATILFERLGSRYILYGEWLHAKHTIFYDVLPHFFLEFDLWDRQENVFLSTTRRRELLVGLPIVSVPVLWQGEPARLQELTSLVGVSRYKSENWRKRLTAICHQQSLDPEHVWKETDQSDLMEGLYIKHEEQRRVVNRYKWIRASFLTTVLDSGTHWLRRPIIPNQLAANVDLFGGAP
jgi:hypothetical protein